MVKNVRMLEDILCEAAAMYFQLLPFTNSCFRRDVFSDNGLLMFLSRASIFGLFQSTRVGTLIVATIYLQLIQNRYMFRSFTVLQCSQQHCVQPVASDVEVVGYL